MWDVTYTAAEPVRSEDELLRAEEAAGVTVSVRSSDGRDADTLGLVPADARPTGSQGLGILGDGLVGFHPGATVIADDAGLLDAPPPP